MAEVLQESLWILALRCGKNIRTEIEPSTTFHVLKVGGTFGGTDFEGFLYIPRSIFPDSSGVGASLAMPLDKLDRLTLDPGTRTLGELLQEREWALGEIRRLRMDVGRMAQKREARRIEVEMERSEDAALNAQRLLRLAEVITMVGLCRSSIYQYVSEGKFPAPVRVGIRGVRWRFSDVTAWQSKIG